MKTRTLLFFLLVLSLLLPGCGSAKTPEAQMGTNTEPLPQTVLEERTPEPVPTEEPAARKSTMLPETYKVPGQKIYVNVPDSSYFSVEWGFSKLYTNGDERGIAITALRTEDAADKSAKDVYASLAAEYLHNMRSYCTAKEMEIDSEQTLTVNGMEAYRFEGRILDNTCDLYTVGYTFVMQGIPCSIQGAVFSNEQNPDSVNEIRSLVDEMITTVRDIE